MNEVNVLGLGARCRRLAWLATLAAIWVARHLDCFAGEAVLGFRAGGNNEFVFDTGVLRGTLRAGGKSAGLSSVVYVATGARLDASMGLLSHYRLFSANHRYGTAAWDFASQARLNEDGSVEAHWPAEPDRPFELTAVYRWTAPDTIDLETRVEARANLRKFESFVASYFAPQFTNAAIYASDGESSRRKVFVTAERSAGVWQAFPRDAAATAIIQDGRWKFEPNPVEWALMPRLTAPLGFRRGPADGLSAVLMAPTKDCFAMLTPFQTEPHYSMYFSLFGIDLKAGQTARARCRLIVSTNLTEAGMVQAQRQLERNRLRGLAR
jgi:hypothetical protein